MNPFVYGEKVKGENFCNREQEIKELVSEITSGQNIMIYSPRRFGKTSLIAEVLRTLDQEGLFTIYIDLYPVIADEDFVRISLKSISVLLSRYSKNILKKIKTFFRRISPSLFVTFSDDGTPSIGINLSKSETLPVIEDIFNGLYSYVKEKQKRAVVVFDEFQQVGELEEARIEKTLRGIIQDHREIAYIFMGSKKHLIYDMFNNPERPFFKSCAHFPLKKIHPGVFSEFIREKFTKTSRGIDEEISSYIIDTVEAHPYYTQLLAHTIWENTENDQKIDKKIVNTSVKRILEREATAFANLWDNLTLKQKRLLLALALMKENDKIFSADFLNRYNLSSSGTVQRGLNSLLAKGIIDKDGNSIEINDIFLKLWLTERMSYSIRQES